MGVRKRLNKQSSKQWKGLFIISFILLLVSWGSLFMLYQKYLPKAEETPVVKEKELKGKPVLTFQLSKNELNNLFEYAVSKNKTKKIEYLPYLKGEELIIDGKVKILGRFVDMKLIGIPEVTKEGNLQLGIDSMQLGELDLPKDRVLQAIVNEGNLPKWITINPKKEQVTILITKLTIEEQFKLEIKEMNLKKDQVMLNIYEQKKIRNN